MRWLRVISIAFVVSVLQVSLLSSLRLDGVVPNLALVVVVCMTVWGSASEALSAAIITGLMMDMAGSGTFGLATSSLVLIALAMVALRQLGLDGQSLAMRIVLVVGASLTWSLIHVAAVGMGSFAMLATWRVVMLELMLNCLLLVVCSERIFRGSRTI